MKNYPIKAVHVFESIFVFLLCLIIQSGIAQENYDEDKIPKYELPEILVSESGKKITSWKEWEDIRRAEILELFKTQVYGRVPDTEVDIQFKVQSTDNNAFCGQATRKTIKIILSNGNQTKTIDLLVYLPNNVAKPVPVFLGLNFYGNHSIHEDKEIPLPQSYVKNSSNFCISNNTATDLSRGVRHSRWPVERILDRGYGLAAIYCGDMDPDFDDGFQNGIHPLFYKKGQSKPGPDQWGTISAWAYGLSRAMDYFETDKDINQEQIAVMGHSRLGKTALWAGALDQRFAIVISNNSGCGGATLSRRKIGETVKIINTSFPHWFCSNFKQYNDNENEMPVDQHQLIGLIAPRPVYVASAEGDKWADPKGEFLSIYNAAPVYKLYGQETLKSDSMPETNKPVYVGNMGYHIRTGRHDVTRYDWERYLDYADMHFSKKIISLNFLNDVAILAQESCFVNRFIVNTY